jgi:5-methylcytosine-specific restriction protein A
MYIPLDEVCKVLNLHPNYVIQYVSQKDMNPMGNVQLSLKCVLYLQKNIDMQNVKATIQTKRKVSSHKKKQVAYNQDWKCNICSQKLPTCYEVDHIVPLFKGGENTLENLQALCRNCHGQKTLKDNETGSEQYKEVKSKYFV